MSDTKFLAPEQLQKLIQSAQKNPKHELQILLMSHGGLRVSEALQMRVQDFDFRNKTMSVQSLKKAEGKQKKRVIPLSDMLFEKLVKYISSKKLGSDDLMFTGRNGQQMQRAAVNKMLRKYEFSDSNLAGLGIHPHKLRHTFATNLRAGGADLMDIQNSLGHEKQDTSMIYAHATPSQMRELLNNAMPKKSLFQRIKEQFVKPKLPPLNLSKLDSRFLVGRDKELKRALECLSKNVNVIITGEVGTGKTHLLEAICSTQKTLHFDDTKEFKKQIQQTILYLHDGDKAKALATIFKTDNPTELKTKISRDSLINLCKVLVSITNRHEYVLQIDDMDGVTPTVVKALQQLNQHFTIITTARKVAIKNTSFLWNFEKIELSNLNRENSLRMIYRLTSSLRVEDYSHLKNKIWESSNGNPRMIYELCDRLSKERLLDRHTVSEVTNNYTGKELKQIDMSIYFLLFFGALAVLRYMSSETGNTSLRFIGGCFMIFVLFARYFFNSFKRSSI